MLAHYFKSPLALLRLRSGPFREHIDGFAAMLQERGHTRRTARCYLRAAAHLGMWMQSNGVLVIELQDAKLKQFAAHLAECRCQGRYQGKGVHELPGARLALLHLRKTGTVPPLPIVELFSKSPLIGGFLDWMRRRRGAAESTLRGYLRHVSAFVDMLGDDPSLYRAGAVRSFLLNRASRLSRASTGNVLSSVRAFLRFLSMSGHHVDHLVAAVPKIANWRLSTLPRYLPALEVEKIIQTCDRTTPAGLRDHAIILLLCRLGLRAGDVAALHIGDLDWAGSRLRVIGKSRRETYLPLPQDVGDAILGYLARGRPSVAGNQELFLGIHAPHRTLPSTAVSSLVKRTILRSAVKAPSTGAHLLRHSAATGLLRSGATLDVIGSLLRHRSFETTAHYAKVDFASLCEVAQPWPAEVQRSC